MTAPQVARCGTMDTDAFAVFWPRCGGRNCKPGLQSPQHAADCPTFAPPPANQ